MGVVHGVDNPPVNQIESISNLIDVMDFVISMMLRLRDYSRTVEKMAIIDQLTSCRNRMALKWAYEDKFDKEKSINVILCDLNGLKQVNDTQGHEAGDKYICDTADILKECFGEEYVYRLGGDEFAIVCLDKEEEYILKKLEEARDFCTLKKINLAMGYAYRRKSHEPFSNILREADRKMYSEKQKYYAEKNKGNYGKNC